MSISVPFGFRVLRGTDLFTLQQQARDSLVETVRNGYIEKYAQRLISVWDTYPDENALSATLRWSMGLDEKEHLKAYPGHYTYHKIGHYLRTENNDAILDPFFSMILWQSSEDDEHLYGSFANTRRETISSKKMYAELLEAGLIEEFAYWNGSDSQISDGDLDEDEWYERGDVWKGILYRPSEELTSIRLPIVGREAFEAEKDEVEIAVQSISDEERRSRLHESIVPHPSVIEIVERAGGTVDLPSAKARYEALAESLKTFSMKEFHSRNHSLSG